jgi:anti-sigma regulatory factor (Ser/Thr protein kinase)
MITTSNFPGYYHNLSTIGNFVGNAAQEAGLDETGVYAVQLAVDEACTNIIEHAYGGEGLGTIDITTIVTDDGLTVILKDSGKSFNPDTVPMPVTNLPLEEIQPRGIGLYLMRKMMDTIQFKFSETDGNVLTMVKRR